MAEIDLHGGGFATPMSGPIVLGSRRAVERSWRASEDVSPVREDASGARMVGALLGLTIVLSTRILVLCTRGAWIGARWCWRKAHA